jgi:membrane protein implicated in regulation of membrane protease activity
MEGLGGELVTQALLSVGSVVVSVAVLRERIRNIEREQERQDKMIGVCFKRIDELRDRRVQ